MEFYYEVSSVNPTVSAARLLQLSLSLQRKPYVYFKKVCPRAVASLAILFSSSARGSHPSVPWCGVGCLSTKNAKPLKERVLTRAEQEALTPAEVLEMLAQGIGDSSLAPSPCETIHRKSVRRHSGNFPKLLSSPASTRGCR